MKHHSYETGGMNATDRSTSRRTRARLRRSVAALCVAGVVALGGCATQPDEVVADRGPDSGWAMRSVETSFEVEPAEPFIRLVDLGLLRVGMTKQEVLALFPEPVATRLRAGDELWDYRFAELIFRGNLLRDWFNR